MKLHHLLALLLVLASVITINGQMCNGQASLFSCDADYATTTCGLCAPGDSACSNGYNTGTNRITAQVCGNSSLTSMSGSPTTFNQQFCCPSGTYVNETYSCSAMASGQKYINGRYFTGSYYVCSTATSSDFGNAIASGLSTIIIIVVAVAVSIGVICLCAIVWCCCGVGACCVGAAKRNTAVVMAQPAVAMYQPMQAQQVYPLPAGQVYSGAQQV